MEPSELHTLVKGGYSQTQDDEGDMGQEILLGPGKAPGMMITPFHASSPHTSCLSVLALPGNRWQAF